MSRPTPRTTPRHLAPLLATALAGALAAGCGDNQDPTGADELWERINAQSFTSWERAPNYPTRRESNTAHSDAVDIYVNPTLGAAIKGGQALTTWPEGSIIVKEGYSGDERKLVAVMEKRADGWYWAEYDGEGSADFSGKPSVCLDCHGSRKDSADWVYAFDLPR